MADHDDAAPGWDAITETFAGLYPGQESPAHWATDVNARALFGGEEYIDGISAYAAEGPPAHWHYVTYGLTELYFKEPDADPAQSGWGFELTVRVPRSTETAPLWPTLLLRAVSRHLASAGQRPPAGSWFRAGRPLNELSSPIGGFLFAEDPQLPALDTEHGDVAFLQLVGLLDDELDWCAEHGGLAFLEGPAAGATPFLTVPIRSSLLQS